MSLSKFHCQEISNKPDTKLALLVDLLSGNFERAPHINKIKNYKIRNSLSRFRLSAHNLPIEIMRYMNIPRDLRLCPFCCSSIGDETHFFMDCRNVIIENSRQQVLQMVTGNNANSSREQMVSILRETEYEILLATGKHIRTIELILKG